MGYISLRYTAVIVPVAAWQRIDAHVENSMAIDVVEQIMETTLVGCCVRDAGWRAAAESTEALDEFGWPPAESPLIVVLRLDHWKWVVAQLDRWAPWAPSGEAESLVGLISTQIPELL